MLPWPRRQFLKTSGQQMIINAAGTMPGLLSRDPFPCDLLGLRCEEFDSRTFGARTSAASPVSPLNRRLPRRDTGADLASEEQHILHTPLETRLTPSFEPPYEAPHNH